MKKNQMLVIKYIQEDLLKPHSTVNGGLVKEIKEQIITDNCLIDPILVDYPSKVVLDGNHRLEALKHIGVAKIPCLCVDYLKDKFIGVYFLKKDMKLSKKKFLENSKKGVLLPPKSLNHLLLVKTGKKPFFLSDLRDL